MAAAKLNRLRDILRGYKSCLVAYSGGVDSVLLTHVAHEVLGDRVLAVLADSPSLPRRELVEAREIADLLGFPLRIVHTLEFANPSYTDNPANRCYYCKHELFTRLEPIAIDGRFAVLAYGENESDIGDHRPGAEAAKQFEVRTPLKEAGLVKGEIREISAALGLPTADKPQMPCLSSRIPYGQTVTPEKLTMIEQAEGVLRDAGFREVRVRHNEQSGGALARLELGPAEMERFVEEDMMEAMSAQIRDAGFADVILDTKGYRRGSLNESVLKAAFTNS